MVCLRGYKLAACDLASKHTLFGHVSLSKKVNKHLISGRFHIKVCFLTSLEKPKALVVLGLIDYWYPLARGGRLLKMGDCPPVCLQTSTPRFTPPYLLFVHVCCLLGSCSHLGLQPLSRLKKVQDS